MYLNNISKIKLINFCRVKGVKGYSKLNKKELNIIVSRLLIISKIQRWIRKYIFNYNDEICSISLEKINYPCFPFVPKPGIIIYYNAKALKEYLLESGDFRDPKTRENYTIKHLCVLDNIEKTTPSVLKAFKNIKKYNKIKEKENEMLILERSMDDIISDVFIDIIDNNNIISIDIESLLNNDYLINYNIEFLRLLNIDKNYAIKSLKEDIESLQLSLDKKLDIYISNDIKYTSHCYLIQKLYQLYDDAF